MDASTDPFERVLLELAVGFVNVPLAELDAAIDRTLRLIGELSGVGRTYLFTYDWDAGTCSNTHEWCRQDVRPLLAELQHVDLQLFPTWVERHRRGLDMYVPDVRDPVVPPAQREMYEEQGVTALVGVPLMEEGACVGFVGFDAVDGPREWSDRDRELLHVLAELLANAMARRSSERAREATRHLTAVNAQLTDFAERVAHDLKAPLATVSGLLALLAEGRVDAGQQADVVDRAMTAARRLAAMIDRLLAYAAAGREIGEPTVVELGPVVYEARDRLHGVIASRTAVVEVTPLPAVIGDGDRLTDVFQNLIANALAHVPPEVVPQVRIRGDRSGDTVRITVDDNGPGIEPADRARVLDVFERGSTLASGTGLGLPICARIVGAHGGRLSLEDADQGGLRVALLLPAPATDAADEV